YPFFSGYARYRFTVTEWICWLWWMSLVLIILMSTIEIALFVGDPSELKPIGGSSEWGWAYESKTNYIISGTVDALLFFIFPTIALYTYHALLKAVCLTVLPWGMVVVLRFGMDLIVNY